MTEEQILEKKQSGDVQTVADMMGVTYQNADRILRRPNAKMHKRAITALTTIIETRESLIKTCKAFTENALNS